MTVKEPLSNQKDTKLKLIKKQLSREIYSGLRLPRERLVEKELAEEFDVSRRKIRDILNELSAVGLVIIQPNKGATVASYSLEDTMKSYEAISVLEGYASMKAIDRLDDADIKKLKAILGKQRKLKDSERDQWKYLNMEFHKIIISRCGNERITNMIRKEVHIINYWYIVFDVKAFRDVVDEHDRIINAIVKKDKHQVRRLVENHIMMGAKLIEEHIKTNMPLGSLIKR